MKIIKLALVLSLFVVIFNNSLFAQRIMLGPRLAGNYNIYNEKNLTASYNGIGISAGGQLDALFNKTVGILVNLNAFDMKNFSNTTTTAQGNQSQTVENSISLAYCTIEPMFQANFSGFFMAAGPSIGFKLNGSGEQTVTQTGGTPQVAPLTLNFKSAIFGIATGVGYNIKLSPDMALGTDFFVTIPISNTFDTPGTSNSVLSLKIGAALKFKI